MQPEKEKNGSKQRYLTCCLLPQEQIAKSVNKPKYSGINETMVRQRFLDDMRIHQLNESMQSHNLMTNQTTYQHHPRTNDTFNRDNSQRTNILMQYNQRDLTNESCANQVNRHNMIRFTPSQTGEFYAIHAAAGANNLSDDYCSSRNYEQEKAFRSYKQMNGEVISANSLPLAPSASLVAAIGGLGKIQQPYPVHFKRFNSDVC